jgi:hypothetical protein
MIGYNREGAQNIHTTKFRDRLNFKLMPLLTQR